MVAHWPQAMQLDYLLSIVFFIFDQVALFKYFFNDARIELSICRVDGLAVGSLFEQLSIRLFENFQQICWKLNHLISAVSFDLRSLLLYVNFLNHCVFPFTVLLDKALSQLADVLCSEQVNAQSKRINFFLFLSKGIYLFSQCNFNIFFHCFQLLSFFLLGFLETDQQIDLRLRFLELYNRGVVIQYTLGILAILQQCVIFIVQWLHVHDLLQIL